jgi:heme/copper-type cytochrome/quinol oxidase subunit 4
VSERPQPGSETSGALGRGWVVFIGLAVLTIVEYILAIAIDANLPILIVLAVAKAAVIIHYFMHLVRVWRDPEEEE